MSRVSRPCRPAGCCWPPSPSPGRTTTPPAPPPPAPATSPAPAAGPAQWTARTELAYSLNSKLNHELCCLSLHVSDWLRNKSALQWSGWSWASCSATCGPGHQVRTRGTRAITRHIAQVGTRHVARPSAGGGRPCAGEARTTRPCSAPPCAVACVWGEWSKWACPGRRGVTPHVTPNTIHYTCHVCDVTAAAQ